MALIRAIKKILSLFRQASTSTSCTGTSVNITPRGDELYGDNEDVLEGSKFSATLHISTPYSVLAHHGETFHGPPSKAPQYGTQAQGIWVPKVKSWKSLGFDLPEFPPSQQATDIGPQYAADYLPFLLAFRLIFENDSADDLKIKDLLALAAVNPDFSKIWRKHVLMRKNFPRCLFDSSTESEKEDESNETGYKLEKEGDIDGAIALYEWLLQQEVGTEFTYRRLAIIYRHRKQPKEEIRVLRAALKNVPQIKTKYYAWFTERMAKISKSK